LKLKLEENWQTEHGFGSVPFNSKEAWGHKLPFLLKTSDWKDRKETEWRGIINASKKGIKGGFSCGLKNASGPEATCAETDR